MNRKRKLVLNTISGIVRQIVAMICGFILPRYMLVYFGSQTNGLVSSINHYLGFISLLDLGVGSVILSNLYKPLAQNDSTEISKVVKSSDRFFHSLGYIFLAYIAVLAILFPNVIYINDDKWFTVSLLFIIAISTFVEYFFGMTNKLLLDADQKAYIPLALATCTTILNTAIAIILMKNGAGIRGVKLGSAIVYTIRPIVQQIYIKAHYKIDRSIKLTEEPIKQKWNGFSQHLSAVVCQNVDVLALSLFSTMENVSIYSVYYTVVYGIQQAIMTSATGVESLFGNLIANNENDKLIAVFSSIEWIVHTIVTVVFTIAAIVIVPFMSVYTRGITDADYQQPVFGLLLVLAYAAMCLRVPYFRIIKASGHFKQTQNGAFISAIINTVITLALVFKFGLIGAAVGTFVALVYHTCYFVFYLKGNILNRPLRIFAKYLLTDCLIGIASFFSTMSFQMSETTYFAWIVLSLKVGLVCLVFSALINFVFYRKEIHTAVSLIKKSN